MGCVPNKQSNIQQKSYQARTSTAPPPRMQQPVSESSVEVSWLIQQLRFLLASQEYNEEQKHSLLNQKLEPNPQQNCKKISEYFGKELRSCTGSKVRPSDLGECMVVSTAIAKYTPHFKCFENFGPKELNGLGTYMAAETDAQVLESWVAFIEFMFLEHEYSIYSTCEILFKSLVGKFSEYKTDNTRELATQILIQMLLENKKLIQYANEPYFFLEFWLYLVNQETQLDRQLYWIESIKKIYASDTNAEAHLFEDNDFKVFVDLLIRVMDVCPDGKSLKIPLECYLVLSTTKRMQPRLHRLEDLKGFVSAINAQSLGIEDLAQEINSLK